MKISTIIPAYNEGANIARVLRVVTSSSDIDEVVVVNDGSTDNTLAEIKEFKEKIKIISYLKNKGKGYALQQGLKQVTGEFVLFLDADLIGLTQNHLKKLKMAILPRPNDLVIGIVKNATRIVGAKLAMLPGGLRIFKKSSLEENFVNQWPTFDHAVDLMISDYFKKKKRRIFFLRLPGLNHIDKHLKYDFSLGMRENIRLNTQFAKAIPKLESWFDLVRGNQIING